MVLDLADELGLTEPGFGLGIWQAVSSRPAEKQKINFFMVLVLDLELSLETNLTNPKILMSQENQMVLGNQMAQNWDLGRDW